MCVRERNNTFYSNVEELGKSLNRAVESCVNSIEEITDKIQIVQIFVGSRLIIV